MAASTVPTLLYLPLRARAEALRMLCRYTGFACEDKVIPLAEWASEWKPKMPNGLVPVLQLADGTLLPESLDIARHIAAQAGPSLLPSDPALAKSAEDAWLFGDNTSFAWISEGLPRFGLVNPLLNARDEAESMPLCGPYLSQVPAALDHIEELLNASAGPFMGGTAPHYGEFNLWHWVDNVRTLGGATVAPGARPKLTAWMAALEALPGVAAYLAERPKTGTGEIGKPNSLVFKHADVSKHVLANL